MELTRGSVKVFFFKSGNKSHDGSIRNISSEILGERILDAYTQLSGEEIERGSTLESLNFSDSESEVSLVDTARGADAFLVHCSYCPESSRSVDEHVSDLLDMIRTLRIADAEKITVILPYFPYARQDKTDGRKALKARLFADQLTAAGVQNILTTDLHANQIEGFFDVTKTKIDNLRASHVLLPVLKRHFDTHARKNLVVMSPDHGGTARAGFYAKQLGVEMAFAYKKRSYHEANVVEHLTVIGEVKGKDMLVIDDMIDSGGTMQAVVERLRLLGARSVILACTHALLSGKGVQRMKEMDVELITTDTIPRSLEFKKENPWYKEFSMAGQYAKGMYLLNTKKSLRPLYQEIE
jgi:ribose-phosphate pyrophosphokinase